MANLWVWGRQIGIAKMWNKVFSTKDNIKKGLSLWDTLFSGSRAGCNFKDLGSRTLAEE